MSADDRRPRIEEAMSGQEPTNGERLKGPQHCRKDCVRGPKWRVLELVGDQLLKALHAQLGNDSGKAILSGN